MMKGEARGFTLIELLVVIAIIGLLSSMVFSSLSTANAKGRDAKRLSEMKQVATALELYMDANNNTAPNHGGNQYGCDSSTCLAVLTDELVPRYLPVIPLDPLYKNVANYGYRYSRCALNTKKFSLLLYNEKTGGWCNVQHPSVLTEAGVGCWMGLNGAGVPDYGWCHQEM